MSYLYRDQTFMLQEPVKRLTGLFPNYTLEPLQLKDLNQGASK